MQRRLSVYLLFICYLCLPSYSDVRRFKIDYLYLVFDSSSYWFHVSPPLLICCLYFSVASLTHHVVLYWLLPSFEKIKTFPLHFLKQLFSSVNCFCFLFMFYLESLSETEYWVVSFSPFRLMQKCNAMPFNKLFFFFKLNTVLWKSWNRYMQHTVL